jgi:hypothetical protein
VEPEIHCYSVTEGALEEDPDTKSQPGPLVAAETFIRQSVFQVPWTSKKDWGSSCRREEFRAPLDTEGKLGSVSLSQPAFSQSPLLCRQNSLLHISPDESPN